MTVTSRTLFRQRRDVAEGFGSSEQCPSLSAAARWSLDAEILWGRKHTRAAPARGGETAFGENTAPMALKQESGLEKQPWGSVTNWISGQIRHR